jgi:aryl-alcohol dehydrogenase-like predicted oxidoreductase
MTTAALGATSLSVSRVILGAWSYGGWYWGGAEDAASMAAIHAAIDAGITSIDTAPVYGFGRSEEVVGRAIQDRRERVQIMTKVGLRWDTEEGAHFFDTEDPNGGTRRIFRNLRAESVRWEVERSLERLGVDHIDVIQCHWPDPSTPIPETMGALKALHREGKVGAIGVSNFSPEQMTEAAAALGDVPLASNQPRYSILHRQIERDVLPHCRENGIGVVVYSPMGRGILTGRVTMEREFPEGDGRRDEPLYHPENRALVLSALDAVRGIAEGHGISLANLAVSWVLHQEGVTGALVGARTVEQAQENARAMSVHLGVDELELMNQAFGAVRINKRPGAGA